MHPCLRLRRCTFSMTVLILSILAFKPVRMTRSDRAVHRAIPPSPARRPASQKAQRLLSASWSALLGLSSSDSQSGIRIACSGASRNTSMVRMSCFLCFSTSPAHSCTACSWYTDPLTTLMAHPGPYWSPRQTTRVLSVCSHRTM